MKHPLPPTTINAAPCLGSRSLAAWCHAAPCLEHRSLAACLQSECCVDPLGGVGVGVKRENFIREEKNNYLIK